LTTTSTAASPAFGENRFLHWICAGMAAAILISAYRPERVFDWALENTLVFFFLVTMVVTYRQFRFSDLAYLAIFLFLCLHEWGAHYKYSDVPLGEWMKPWLHTQRNHYDRVCHFTFGLMFSYPMREIAIRALRVTGAWRYYLPVECTLALSAIYEMMEAGMASILSPERGHAGRYVGFAGRHVHGRARRGRRHGDSVPGQKAPGLRRWGSRTRIRRYRKIALPSPAICVK
jgi:putative membrane protein